MKSEQRTQAFLRKRKMLLVMPLMVVPFLCMGFWALGGGKGENKITTTVAQKGLNLQLPGAVDNAQKSSDNKMSFYEQADKDSLQMEQWMRSDPYYMQEKEERATSELEEITSATAKRHDQRLNPTPYEKGRTRPEEQIMDRLSQINREINQPVSTAERSSKRPSPYTDETILPGTEIDRLEGMLQMMNDKGSGGDPELAQLDNTLEKILDIQHPDRVKERIKIRPEEEQQPRFAVRKAENEVPVSILGVTDNPDSLARMRAAPAVFFGPHTSTTPGINANTIEAVIHQPQTIVNGSIVKLRLLDDLAVSSARIPKGNFVYGVSAINGERLDITIESIRHGQSLYPVQLDVYDLDGLPGIYVPGTITRDVLKQSADNSLQLMQLQSLDPSLKAQATASGIDAVKNLLSRKIKLVRVQVKAGYKVLLKDKKANQ